MKPKHLLWFVLAMLAVDWILGAAQAAHVIPLWTFLAANIPFGLPYVWLESHWTGTAYDVGGYTVSDTMSLAVFFFTVIAQGWLYAVCFQHWQKMRSRKMAEAQPI